MPAEINIPVRVQILKDSISDLLNSLSNLKVDSTSFKTISKYIQEMTREMTQFLAMTSRPFGKQSLFNKASSSIEKMESILAKARIAMDDIKFPEMKLSSALLAEWDNFGKIMDLALLKLNQVKTEAKENILSSMNAKTLFGDLDSKYLEKSFDDLFSMVDRKTQELDRKVGEALSKLSDFNAGKLARHGRLDALRANGISPEGLGEQTFNRFFETVKGNLRFKSVPGIGSLKDDFIKFLCKDLFSLSDVDLKKFADSLGKSFSAKDLNKVLMSLGSKNIFSHGIEKSSFSKLSELARNLEDLTKRRDEYYNLRQQFEDASFRGDKELLAGRVGAALNAYEETLDSTRRSMEEFGRALEVALRNGNMPKAITASNAALELYRETLARANVEYTKYENAQRNFTNMKMAISNFMGFYLVLNLTKRAVKEAMSHIKDLDSVMNKISIVTDMSTGDLWKLVDSYSKMAQQYGVSIKGAYEVSLIYYQLGLEQKEVLELTNETLKLSKISGLDYATTTDYMTTAIRGFKMEAKDAGRVVDVYSNLAAHTAVSLGELAIGMSKTASSLESVGASFEESSAMIATMVAVTRESSTNIGSAMKSIASRYGEMKKDITTMVDEEGEALSYNKVDTALLSVGISLKDTNGQFRNMTDVIIELGEKWDTLDSIQQRYIATLFAGNRQQSRFLALVSNVDLLKSNLNYALDSEDTGDIQALKALDSIESRTEQLKVAYQLMYTTIGAEGMWKGALGGLTEFMNTLNGLPKLFDKIPIGAMSMVYDVVNVVKTLGLHAVSGLANFILGSLNTETIANRMREISNKGTEALESETKRNLDRVEATGADIANSMKKGQEKALNDEMLPATKPEQKAEQVLLVTVDSAKVVADTLAVIETAQETATSGEKVKIESEITPPTNAEEVATETSEKTQLALTDLALGLTTTTNVNGNIEPLKAAIDSQDGRTITVNVNANLPDLNNLNGSGNAPTGPASAAGNFKTLLGELGPELYVSDGRYHIAGAYGPEMVDLPSDAIIFNHLLTEDLLKNLKTSTNGKPVNNDRKSVAMAAGTVDWEEIFKSYLAILKENPLLKEAFKAYEDLEAEYEINDRLHGTISLEDYIKEHMSPELYTMATTGSLTYPLMLDTYHNLQLLNKLKEADEKQAAEERRLAEELEARKKERIARDEDQAYEEYNRANERELEKLYEEAWHSEDLMEYALIIESENATHRYLTHGIPGIKETTPITLPIPHDKYIEEIRAKRIARENDISYSQLEPDSVDMYDINDIIDKETSEIEEYIDIPYMKKLLEYRNIGRENLSEFELLEMDDLEKNYGMFSPSSPRRIAMLLNKYDNDESIFNELLVGASEASVKAVKKSRLKLLEEFESLRKLSKEPDAPLEIKDRVTALAKELNIRKNISQQNLEMEKTAAKINEDADVLRIYAEELAQKAKEELERIEARARAEEEARQAAEAKKAAEVSELGNITLSSTQVETDSVLATLNLKLVEDLMFELGNKHPTVAPQFLDETIPSLRFTGRANIYPYARLSDEDVDRAAKELMPKEEEYAETREAILRLRKLQLEDEKLFDEKRYERRMEEYRKDPSKAIEDEKRYYAELGRKAFDSTPVAHIIGAEEQTKIKMAAQELAEAAYPGDIAVLKRLGLTQHKPLEQWTDEEAAGLSPESQRIRNEIIALRQGQSINTPESEREKGTPRIDLTPENRKFFTTNMSDEQIALLSPYSRMAMMHRKAISEGRSIKDISIDTKEGITTEVNFEPNTTEVEAAATTVKEPITTEVNFDTDQNALDPVIDRAEAALDPVVDKTEAAVQTMVGPRIGASLDNVFNMETGDVYDNDSMLKLLSQLQELKIINEEQLRELFKSFLTDPSEKFVSSYDKLTNALSVIADANLKMIYPDEAFERAKALSRLYMHSWDDLKSSFNIDTGEAELKIEEVQEQGKKPIETKVDLLTDEAEAKTSSLTDKLKNMWNSDKRTGGLLTSTGSGLNMLAGMIKGVNGLKGAIMGVAGAMKIIGGIMSSSPMAIITGIMAVWNAIDTIIEDDNEKLERLTKNAEELSNKAKEAKADYKTLDKGIKKVEELEKKRYDSLEAAEEYLSAVEDLTNKFPLLIIGFDEAGNAIYDAASAEAALASARSQSALATYEAAKALQEANAQLLKVDTKEIALTGGVDLTDFTNKMHYIDSKKVEEVNKVLEKLYTFSDNWNQMINKGHDIGVPVDLTNPIDVMDRFFSYRFNEQMDESVYLAIIELVFNGNDEKLYDLNALGELVWNPEQLYKGFNELDEKADLFTKYPWLTDLLQYLSSIYKSEDLISTSEVNPTDNKELKWASDVAGKFNKFLNDFYKLTEASKAGNTTETLKAYENLINSWNELNLIKSTLDEDALKAINSYNDPIIGILQKMGDLKASIISDAANSKLLVNSYISSTYAMSNFIEDGSGLITIASSYYGDLFNLAVKDSKYSLTWDQWLELTDKDGNTWNTDIVNTGANLESFWSATIGQGEEVSNKLTSMLKNKEQYHYSDFEKEFGDITGWETFAPFLSSVMQLNVDNISERLENLAKTFEKEYKTDEDKTFIADFKEKAKLVQTSSEEAFLNSTLKLYKRLTDLGYTKDAGELSTEALALFENIEKLPEEVRTAVLEYILEDGIFTKSGIKKVINKIKNNDYKEDDALEKGLNGLSDNLHENILLTVSSTMSDFSENIKKNKGLLLKLTSGIDIEDIETLISSEAGKAIGLTTEDFKIDGNKMSLTADKAKEYVKEFYKSENTVLEDNATKLKDFAETFKIEDVNKLDEVEFSDDLILLNKSMVEDIIGAGGLTPFIGEDGKIITEKRDELYKLIREKYKETTDELANYDLMLDFILKSFTKSEEWEKGDYSSLKSSFGLEEIESTNAALQTKLESLMRYDSDLSTYVNTPDVKNAITKIRSTVSSFLSDSISKGINNIDLTDYKGLPSWIANDIKENRDTYKSNYDLVKKYARYTGDTIADSNNLIAEALEKDVDKTSTDALKDLTFINNSKFTAGIGALKDFANRYNINLTSLIDSGIAKYDKSIGEYIVDLNSLAYADTHDLIESDFDSSAIEGFKEAVEDSIKSYLANLAELITNGLEGTLSSTDAKSLKDKAKFYGVKDVIFEKTNAGWALTENSSAELLQAMHDNNASIAETNKLTIAHMKKNLHNYTAEDIKDLTFLEDKKFAATEDSLLKFAEKFNLDLYSLIDDGIINWSTQLDQYIVDYSGLADVQGIDGFQETVDDSINSFWKNLGDLISSGISGSLTNVLFKLLKDTLAAAGIKNLDELDFTQTADGLLLSTDSAIQLLDAVSQTDVIARRGIFDNVTKRLKENNKNYKTSTALLSHILKLLRRIEQATKETGEAHEDLLKQLEREKRLIDEMSLDNYGNANSSWDFMNSGEMPGSFQNDISYYSAWANAMASMDLWAQTGRTDPNQFYSLISHRIEMAEALGRSVTFLGKELGGETGMSLTELESQLGKALRVSSKYGAYYDNKILKELGFNMEEGSSTMKKNNVFTEIDEYLAGDDVAIDAWNNYMGGITKVKTLLTKDGKEWQDFFGDTAEDFDVSGFNSWMSKLSKDVLDTWNNFASNIDMGGTTLEQALSSEGEFKKNATAYSNMMRTVFSMMFDTENWDPTNRMLSLSEMWARYSKGLNEWSTTVDGNEIAGRNGKVVVKKKGSTEYVDEDGNPVGTTAQDALNYVETLAAKDVGDAANKNKSKGYKATETGYELNLGDGFNFAVDLTKDKPRIINQTTGEEINNKTMDQLVDEAYADYKAKNGNNAKSRIDWEVEVGLSSGLNALAQSVFDGIRAAFTQTGEDTVSSSITTAILNAFSEPFPVDIDDTDAIAKLKNLQEQLTGLSSAVPQLSIEVTDNASGPLEAIIKLLKEIQSKSITVTATTVTLDGTGTKPKIIKPGLIGRDIITLGTNANGTVGLAHAKSTLMGELGPELVVSNGRYFVVGQSGPEMVNLADDAIVFNHLQTKSLLEKGTSSTRGHAITSEKNAVAYATGSRNGGPAKAGPEEMLINPGHGDSTSAEVLNPQGKKPDDKALKSFIAELERWYSWLLRIAKVEKEITYQESLRTKYQSDFIRTGKEYYESQKKTLSLLKDQLIIQQKLIDELEKALNSYKKKLEKSPASQLWRIDERGLMNYTDTGYEVFSGVFGKDEYNKPNYTTEELYQKLIDLGFESYMQYDKSGLQIDTSKEGWKTSAVQAGYDYLISIRDEGLELVNSLDDLYESNNKLKNDLNEILKEIEDNLISVEQKVLKAIEDSRERAIEDSKKERDAIEKANLKLIDGLNKLLEQERTMRLNLKSADELSTLQRRLAILQRSGGSASEIALLQLEITDKQYDKYFETQEQLIQAIEDASKLLLERLDNLIEIMEETLEYEKLHGLLWNQVYDVLQGSPEDIATFIQENDSSYWNKSVAELLLTMREDIFSIDKYKALISDAPSGDINELRTKVVGYIEDLLKEETSTEGNGEAAGQEAGSGDSGGSSDNSGTNNPKLLTYYASATVTGYKGSTAGTTVTGTGSGKTLKEALENALKDAYSLLDSNTMTTSETTYGKAKKVFEYNGEEYTSEYAANKAKEKDIKEAEKVYKNTKITTSTEAALATANLNVVKNRTVSSKIITKEFGGMVDETGMELVHAKEAVLTPEQASILRNDILGSSKNSLMNLLLDFRSAYEGLSSSTYDSISNTANNSVTIERAEVNLQIDELANDYDARRAANTVMNELLQIARKTSASNRVGRR